MAVSININGLSLVHRGSGGTSTATLPDVCATPPDGRMVPYPNVAYSRDLRGGSRSVTADGGHPAAHATSRFARSTGDEPGEGGGVKSGIHRGPATWLTHSFNVRIEGKGACRLTDKMLHNGGNTVDCAGEVQAPVPRSASARARAAARRRAEARAAARRRRRNTKLEIAIQDYPMFEGADYNNPAAVALREALFTKAWQMGARFLRVNCYWGKWDTWDRIDVAIAAAHARGFAVQVTLTGGSAGWTGGRGVNVKPKEFGDFVAERVKHYTKGGVKRFSLWNEPNHPMFFTAGPYAMRYLSHREKADLKKNQARAEPDPTKKKRLEEQSKEHRRKANALFANRIFPANARHYARVYAEGYKRAKAAAPGAQIHMGELSSHRTMEFLRAMARVKRLRADGLALHPYQYTVDPRKPDASHETGGGMGNLPVLIAQLKRLKEKGRLRTRKGKAVPIYLTEFGYHKKEGRIKLSDDRQIRETKRAIFMKRALGVALKLGIRQVLQYQLKEGPVAYPDGQPVQWDTSVLEPDLSPNRTYRSIMAWFTRNKRRVVRTPAEIAKALKV